jgi:demethylmenaquinone methyltransferase/2-methoxy-6-polyprenyl-1,4-benzoquinol methylase
MDKRIDDLFSSIYERYDFFNHLFSFGFDIKWRRKVAGMAILQRDNYQVLDVGTGTGDLAIYIWNALQEWKKHASITGIDFNVSMLSKAVEKAKTAGILDIRFEKRDALKTGYKNGSFDLIVSGFVLRSVGNLHSFSGEMARLLKPGGRILLLDMAYPKNRLARVYFDIHFWVMAAIGSLVGKDEAYGWLFGSIKAFDKKELISVLSEDFDEIRMQELSPGIAYVVSGRKKTRP